MCWRESGSSAEEAEGSGVVVENGEGEEVDVDLGVDGDVEVAEGGGELDGGVWWVRDGRFGGREGDGQSLGERRRVLTGGR
jgi:hypothetical protein